MEEKYLMDVKDVMNELGVSRSKAYQIIRELNDSLEADGYKALAGRIPRPYWKTKFYGYKQMAGQQKGVYMSVYKDKKQGTWYVSFRYVDWTGKKKQKLKRGFRTKKEAQEYEVEFKRKASADMDMELGSFVEIYFEDKKNELKQNSIRNKKHMITAHVIPYFGNKKMNEILPADIIQWQNIIQEKNFSKTYERMLQNQITALFNHAQKIYNLQNNPCKKVKKIGKPDADKMEFWTKEEYEKFISTIEPGTDNYLMAELLFWTGMREGEMLALTPKDIDFSENQISISKTYYRAGGKDVITTPKTYFSSHHQHSGISER